MTYVSPCVAHNSSEIFPICAPMYSVLYIQKQRTQKIFLTEYNDIIHTSIFGWMLCMNRHIQLVHSHMCPPFVFMESFQVIDFLSKGTKVIMTPHRLQYTFVHTKITFIPEPLWGCSFIIFEGDADDKKSKKH
jgi:hypothetical protein